MNRPREQTEHNARTQQFDLLEIHLHIKVIYLEIHGDNEHQGLLGEFPAPVQNHWGWN